MIVLFDITWAVPKINRIVKVFIEKDSKILGNCDRLKLIKMMR